MRFCTRCLYSDHHPLGITFDEGGVCSGCLVHEEKDALDWMARESDLRSILDNYRNQSGGNYDCIVPVSGAGDSFYIVDVLKRKYNMNPLLVSYNSQFNSPVGIRNLQKLRDVFDCDHISLTLDPILVKRIVRETLLHQGSMYWHHLAGRTVFPVRAAVGYKVPLIIWGAHQGCDQVGMFSHLSKVEMSQKYRFEHDLMGVEVDELLSLSSNLTERELSPLRYPSFGELESVGVRGIYLSNFIRWDSISQHEQSALRYNHEAYIHPRSFDTRNHADCVHYLGIHDYLKFLRHGYSKVTDHACREIRLGRITRDQAIELVTHHTQQPVNDFKIFAQWIGMTRHELARTLEKAFNPKVWKFEGNSRYSLKYAVSDQILENNQSISVREDVRLHSEYRNAWQSSSLLLRGFTPPGSSV